MIGLLVLPVLLQLAVVGTGLADRFGLMIVALPVAVGVLVVTRWRG